MLENQMQNEVAAGVIQDFQGFSLEKKPKISKR